MPTAKEAIEQGLVVLPSGIAERWEERQLLTMWSTVAKDLSIPEFEMFLTIAGKYELDPLLREIWAVKGKAKDGKPGRLMILVGRDGLLRNARRDPRYRGFDSDVVREKDEFEVIRTAAGREVRHKYVGGAKERGPIIGAWAQVYSDGQHDSYFFASWDEYAPTGGDSFSPWKKQGSVMIQKVALSLCLRLHFNLSGVVGEDEAASVVDGGGSPDLDGPDLHEVLVDVDADLRDRLVQAYLEARNIRPGQVSVAVVQMSVSGQPREVVEAYAERLEAENAAARGSGAEKASDDVPDAEVVEDEPSLSPDAEALRQRLSDLLDKRADVEENPSGYAETEQALADLDAEISQVEEELRAAGASVPGQEAMPI